MKNTILKKLKRNIRVAKLYKLNGLNKKGQGLAVRYPVAAKLIKWIFENTIENQAWAPSDESDVEMAKEKLKSRIHEQLNIMGLAPVIGSVPLIINAILFHMDGDDYNAGLSLVGAVLSMLAASGEIELLKGILPPSSSQRILESVTRLTSNLPFGSSTIMENTIEILSHTQTDDILNLVDSIQNFYGANPSEILISRSLAAGGSKVVRR